MASPVTSLIILLLGLNSFCLCVEIFSGIATAFGVGALSASYAGYNYLKCRNSECCDDNWIHFNEINLNENLENLYGQHLAASVIRKSLRGYFKNSNPKKPLVMAFHGLTGSGKNYAARLIANSIYKNGQESRFVHVYIGSRDFPHKQKISKYQDFLREEIPKHTKECERSLFIFDEVDKMPPGTIDAIKPFIDYYGTLDNINFRKNIFIFLSNSGSSDIVKVALNFWANGEDRHAITMKDIEPLVNKGAYNENGGFKFSELLSSELIDVFVPFLPLERAHVKKCIAAEMKNRQKYPEDELINKIADELVYFPHGVDLYSKSGCKRIEQKVDLLLDV